MPVQISSLFVQGRLEKENIIMKVSEMSREQYVEYRRKKKQEDRDEVIGAIFGAVMFSVITIGMIALKLFAFV